MTYNYIITKPPLDEEILEHHGIKGMRWGVRRYQNDDGSLTEKGKKRYGYNLDLNDKSRKNIAKIRRGEARRRLDYAKLHGSTDTRKAELQGRLRSAKSTLKNVKRFDKGAKLAAKGHTIYGNKSRTAAAEIAGIAASFGLAAYLDKRIKDLGNAGRLTEGHVKVASLVNAAAGLAIGGLILGYKAKKNIDNRNLRVYNNLRWSGESSMKKVGSQEYADRLKTRNKK